MSRYDPDDEGECVVVTFTRLPSGELRCRIVEAVSKIAWYAPLAETLHRLIFAQAPGGLGKTKLSNQRKAITKDELTSTRGSR